MRLFCCFFYSELDVVEGFVERDEQKAKKSIWGSVNLDQDFARTVSGLGDHWATIKQQTPIISNHILESGLTSVFGAIFIAGGALWVLGDAGWCGSWRNKRHND